jgi:endogenous inhibitor of DNA gyrase (YacG/DUF329 family)
MLRKCEQCKKQFNAKKGNIERGWGKFCSKDCSNLFKTNKPRKGNYLPAKRKTVVCHTCGKEFICPDTKGRLNAKFCSHKCKAVSIGYRDIGKILLNGSGYYYIRLQVHPFANNGAILYHRFLVEQYLRENNPKSDFLIKIGENFYLSPHIDVHHINEIKTDNYLSNFYICSHSEHTGLHKNIKKNDLILKPNFLL